MTKPITEEETVINAASKYVINMESKALNERLFYSMFFEYQGYLSEENTMLLQEQRLCLEGVRYDTNYGTLFITYVKYYLDISC